MFSARHLFPLHIVLLFSLTAICFNSGVLKTCMTQFFKIILIWETTLGSHGATASVTIAGHNSLPYKCFLLLPPLSSSSPSSFFGNKISITVFKRFSIYILILHWEFYKLEWWYTLLSQHLGDRNRQISE